MTRNPRVKQWFIAFETRRYRSTTGWRAPLTSSQALAGIDLIALQHALVPVQRTQFSESEPATGPPEDQVRLLVDSPRGPSLVGVTLAAA